jgi:hypothetical protein
MRTAAVVLALVFLGCSGSSEDEQESCVTLESTRRVCGDKSVTLPFSSSDGSARVNARVNGKAVELLLDTGAEATVLSPSLLGVANETLASADEICFGALCLQNEPVYAWETPFSSASGDGPSGFVGMHTLKELRFELDGSVALLELGGDACSGTSVPLVFNQYGIPMVDVTAHTLPSASIPIDTGATYTLFSQATSDALDAALEPKEPAPLCTVNGCQPNGAFTSLVPSYCVGTECETDVPVKFPAFDAVGMTYFARRHVQFDFSASSLWFCEP